jgi:Spy/CpxP family protein refolding chaperone
MGPGAQGQMQRPMTRIQRMAEMLRLTPDQQQKARTLFRSEANELRTAHRQARNTKEALHDAVRANTSDSDIDRLAQAAGSAQGAVQALHVKTMTKFYAMLNQDQKDLFDEHGANLMRAGRRGPGGQGQGRGPGMRRMGPGGGMGPGGQMGPGMRRGGPVPPPNQDEDDDDDDDNNL